MKSAKWILVGLLASVGMAIAGSVYNYFPPPGITYTETGGMALGSATGGGEGAGSLNAQALYINGVPVGSATGSVSSVSVVSANGLSGTVATPTTTPAITLAPTFTGIAYSTGSALQAATAPNFPTLNQDTTGNAATATLASTASAFATTPALCGAGQAAQGILANGNATGCVTAYSVVNESANTAFMGPPSGTAALPAFRTLVAADLPLSSPLTFTGANTMQPGSGVALTINGAASSDTLDINNASGQFTNVVGSSASGLSNGLEVIAGTTSGDTAFKVLNRSASATLFSVKGDGTTSVLDSAGGGPYQVGYLGTPLNTVTTAYTLALSDRGKAVHLNPSGGGFTVTIPSGVFSPGDVITLIADHNATAYTISPASGVTLYWAIGNDTATGARTLTSVGVATLICVSANEFFITGSGVS